MLLVQMRKYVGSSMVMVVKVRVFAVSKYGTVNSIRSGFFLSCIRILNMKRAWPEFLERVERLNLTIDDRRRCFVDVREIIETTGSSTIDTNAEHAFLTTTRYASYIYVAMCGRVVEAVDKLYHTGERWRLPSVTSYLNRVSSRDKQRTMLYLTGIVDDGIDELTPFAIETFGPCFKPLVEDIVVDHVAVLNKKKKRKTALADEKIFYLRQLLEATGLAFTEKKTVFVVTFGRTCIQVIANGKSTLYGIIDGLSSHRLSLDDFDRYAAFIETGTNKTWQRDDAPRLSKLRRPEKPVRRTSSSRIDTNRVSAVKHRGSTSSSSSERSHTSESSLIPQISALAPAQ